MNSGSFDQGLLNMTNWFGNGVMPVMAALILAMGIYQYSKGRSLERYIYATLGALLVSGVLRLTEHFAALGTGTNQIFDALLGLANWIGNVILPVYAAIEVTRAVLGVSGVFSRLNIGDDWVRHFVAAGASLCCSGLLRLLEHFVAAGTGGVA